MLRIPRFGNTFYHISFIFLLFSIELTNSRCVLQKEVKELETLLATYDNKDGEYHKLVKRYVDCQQQLSLRSTLLHDNDTIQLNRRSHKNFSSRRSLSVDVITRK